MIFVDVLVFGFLFWAIWWIRQSTKRPNDKKFLVQYYGLPDVYEWKGADDIDLAQRHFNEYAAQPTVKHVSIVNTDNNRIIRSQYGYRGISPRN